MEFKGRVWKSKERDQAGQEFWLVEVPALDVMTQGFSRGEALEMIVDAIKVLWNEPERDSMELEVLDSGEEGEEFLVTDNGSGHLGLLKDDRMPPNGRCDRIYQPLDSRCVMRRGHDGKCAFPNRSFRREEPELFEYFRSTHDWPFKLEFPREIPNRGVSSVTTGDEPGFVDPKTLVSRKGFRTRLDCGGLRVLSVLIDRLEERVVELERAVALSDGVLRVDGSGEKKQG